MEDNQKSELLQSSLQLISTAVQHDEKGEIKEAIFFYLRGMKMLLQLIERESDPRAKEVLVAKFTEYHQRSEILKEHLKNLENQQHDLRIDDFVDLFPSIPTSTPPMNKTTQGDVKYQNPTQETTNSFQTNTTQSLGDNHSQNNDVSPNFTTIVDKVIQIDNDYQIHQQVGSTIQQGINKVSELDEKYKIHETVGQTLKEGINKTVELNNEYKIHEKILNGVSTSFQKAKELNDEYEITQTVGNTLKNGVQKVIELDREHQIHQKIGNTISSGISKVVELDEKYNIHQRVGETITSGINSIWNYVSTSNKN